MSVTTYNTKAGAAPSTKIPLDPDAEAAFGRQALLDAEAQLRARNDSDPFIRDGRFTPAEAARMAKAEAALVPLKARQDEARGELLAAQEALRIAGRWSNPDEDAHAREVKVVAAESLTLAAQRLFDGAIGDLRRGDFECRRIERNVTAGIRRRQFEGQLKRNAEAHAVFLAETRASERDAAERARNMLGPLDRLRARVAERAGR